MPIIQPHVHPTTGDVLCWNGEIFNGMDISEHENDGVRLLRELTSLSNPETLVEILGSVEGPTFLNSYFLLAIR